MKHFQLALLFFICIAKSFGQAGSRSFGRVDVEITNEKKTKRILTKVEITAAFPGGDSAWAISVEERLNKTLKHKRKAKSEKYLVSVRFLIERDGSVTDIKCLNDPGFEICEQIKYAILRSTLGRWRPAIDSGKRVREYHTSAIIFPPSSLKFKIDSIRRLVPFPSGDLLPPELTSTSARNEYYGESDTAQVISFVGCVMDEITVARGLEEIFNWYDRQRTAKTIALIQTDKKFRAYLYQALIGWKPINRRFRTTSK